MEDIQVNLYSRAEKHRTDSMHYVDSYEEFKKAIDAGGFVMAHWDGTNETEEKIKKETKATIRCILLDGIKEEGSCILTGAPSKQRVVFAKAY